MLGNPISRQASSTYYTACFPSHLFLQSAPIRVTNDIRIAPCHCHFLYLSSLTRIPLFISKSSLLQPSQNPVSWFSSSSRGYRVLIPSLFCFIFPSSNCWGTGAWILASPSPFLWIHSMDKWSYSHLHLCSLRGILFPNYGITADAGKCTRHPILLERLSSHIPLWPSVWFLQICGSFALHWASSVLWLPL